MDGARSSSSKRRMVRSELAGRHTHKTQIGVDVHIYERDGQFLARGRWNGSAFGETLGAAKTKAEIALRRVLTEIDEGRFIPPRQRARRPISTKIIPNLRLLELADRFLHETRAMLGDRTMQTYRSRLTPVLEFAELPVTRRRWPLARDIDRDFAIDLKTFLFTRQVTANGHDNGKKRRISVRQIRNIVECFRAVLAWALRPQVRLLPPEFVSPITFEIVRPKRGKDPLRSVKLPIDVRLRLLQYLDCWHIACLGILFVLPLRPEEVAGVLISDIDLEKRELHVGERFGGDDFTKGGVSFTTPIPAALVPILKTCIGDRVDGPLFQRRNIWNGERSPKRWVATGRNDILDRYEAVLAREEKSIKTQQDRKRIFREVLREYGGVTPNEIAREFKRILRCAGLPIDVKLYDLRHAITTDMNRSGMRMLEQRYLTSHTTSDILNEYVALDPHHEMQKYEQCVSPLLTALSGYARNLGCIDESLAV